MSGRSQGLSGQSIRPRNSSSFPSRPGILHSLKKEKDSISKLVNTSTVKSLEFVDANFLWILLEPLIRKINVHPQLFIISYYTCYKQFSYMQIYEQVKLKHRIGPHEIL